MLNDIVSKRLRELRNGVKLSQGKLAAKLNTKQPLIARYETGQHLPPVEILVKYAPMANNHLIEVLEKEGAEVIVPELINFILYCSYDAKL